MGSKPFSPTKLKLKKMLYAIKINKTNRYITYCDKCWYETTANPIYLFTKEQAEEIVNTMRNHYVYVSTIISEDGKEVITKNFLVKENPMTATTAPKKSILKFKVRI